MGKVLTELASTSKIIVEIGTGSGLGSTQCLINGMQRGESRSLLITIEGVKEQFDLARRNITDPYVLVHYGILHRWIVPYHHPIDMIQHRECYAAELALVNNPDVPVIQVPSDQVINLLLLDGGEFTSVGDFLRLWQRCKVIVLDDCNRAKASKNWWAYEVLYDAVHARDWVMEHSKPEDRNGWAVFRRKE